MNINSPRKGADFITEHQNHKVTIAHVTAGDVYSDPLEGKFDANIQSETGMVKGL